MKYSKEITLAIAPYKMVKIAVTEAGSFEECDQELQKEIERMPGIKELNEAEIQKVFGNGEGE